MSPTTELTPAVKVTVLKHLINDRNTEFIVAATGLTHDQVTEVKRDHGYPEVDKMKWAKDILEKKAGEIPASTVPTPRAERPAGAPLVRPGNPPTRPAAAQPAPAVVVRTPDGDITTAPLVEQLIVRAKDSTKASTRKLGERVQTLVEQLRTTVEAEDRAKREAARAAAADAERKAEIARLEAQLAQLRGAAPKKPATTSTSGTGDSKAIRAWAAENGVDCPKAGRVPGAVREAYEAAHQGDAA